MIDQATCIDLRRLRREEIEKDAGKALAVAKLTYAASPEFYDLIPVPEPEMLQIVARQIAVPGTELENTYVLSRDQVDVASLSAVGSAALPAAQKGSLLAILRSLDRDRAAKFTAAVKTFSAALEPLTIDSTYVARLAVDGSARGSGAGTEIIQGFLEAERPRFCSLHVHKDNATAIRFYSKLGFSFLSDGPHLFRVMVLDRNRPA
jgi:ribosomal protein S18 acetylase RimI-like enzyme